MRAGRRDQYSDSAQSNDGLARGECGNMWQASPLLVALLAVSALLLVPIAKPFAQAATVGFKRKRTWMENIIPQLHERARK
ncbi:unnamed protein product [Nezara viridula]|uniref:Uncharacterized protein n=1 Tax=Nezara viridula TaxID=85310 RepID=A0A9P0E1C9_NEZVI|nr:unnamed protein product [Nezara viridula]